MHLNRTLFVKVAVHYYGRLAAKQGWRFDSTYDHRDENGEPIPFEFILGSGKVGPPDRSFLFRTLHIIYLSMAREKVSWWFTRHEIYIQQAALRSFYNGALKYSWVAVSLLDFLLLLLCLEWWKMRGNIKYFYLFEGNSCTYVAVLKICKELFLRVELVKLDKEWQIIIRVSGSILQATSNRDRMYILNFHGTYPFSLSYNYIYIYIPSVCFPDCWC